MNSITFASLLLIFSTAVLADWEDRFFDGTKYAYHNDAGIRDLAAVAVKRYAHDTHSNCTYWVNEVLRAGTQLVEGTRTVLQLRICPYACVNEDICKCKLKATDCRICFIETWERVWIRDFQVTQFRCPAYDDKKTWKPKLLKSVRSTIR